MKLGVHANAWENKWRNEPSAVFKKVNELGLDFIEIPLVNIASINTKFIREQLLENEITACTSTLLNHDFIDITSEDSTIRKQGIDYLKQCVDVTYEIGSDFFSGVIYSKHLRTLENRPNHLHWELSAECLREVAIYAQKFGVRIGLEPINRYESYLINTCEQGLELIDMIGEINVGIHLDSYHMNMEEKSFYDATIKAGQKLLHYHLNENDWGMLGTGHVNWEEIFAALKKINYQGYASIESVVNFDGMFVWRQLASSGDNLVKDGVFFIREMQKKFGLI